MIKIKSLKRKSGKSVKKKTLTGKMWRLIHDGTTAFVIIEGTSKDKTETILEVSEFSTEAEALMEISNLGLKYEGVF